MNEITENKLPKTSTALGYFILSYCLLVPTAGTLVFYLVSGNFDSPIPPFVAAICFYLSSVIVGLLGLTRFAMLFKREERWGLIVGIILSSICGLLLFVVWVLCHISVIC